MDSKFNNIKSILLFNTNQNNTIDEIVTPHESDEETQEVSIRISSDGKIYAKEFIEIEGENLSFNNKGCVKTNLLTNYTENIELAKKVQFSPNSIQATDFIEW